jgi:hypothetical protein
MKDPLRHGAPRRGDVLEPAPDFLPPSPFLLFLFSPFREKFKYFSVILNTWSG